MRISDWSSDMCSSDLAVLVQGPDAILDDVPVFSRSIPRPVEGNGVRGKHPLLRAEREKAEPCIADLDAVAVQRSRVAALAGRPARLEKPSPIVFDRGPTDFLNMAPNVGVMIDQATGIAHRT